MSINILVNNIVYSIVKHLILYKTILIICQLFYAFLDIKTAALIFLSYFSSAS